MTTLEEKEVEEEKEGRIYIDNIPKGYRISHVIKSSPSEVVVIIGK